MVQRDVPPKEVPQEMFLRNRNLRVELFLRVPQELFLRNRSLRVLPGLREHAPEEVPISEEQSRPTRYYGLTERPDDERARRTQR